MTLGSILIVFLLLVAYSTGGKSPSSGLITTVDSSRSRNHDWVYQQAKYCGKTCRNGSIFNSYECYYGLDCFPCDCDDQCELFGTCCPVYDETTDTYHYAFESSLDGNPHQWYNRLDCRTPSANDGTFLAVVGCPESWLDQDVKEKCEKPNKDSMEAVTPFSDKATGLVFTNAFCAMCNGHEIYFSKGEYNRGDDRDDKEDVNNNNDDDYGGRIFPWKLVIECPQFQTMYTITDQFEFYKALKGNGCKYQFKAPFGTPWAPRRCDHRVLTDLNTIQLENYNSSDSFFGNLCHTLPPIPALTIKGNRNIFCALAVMRSAPQLTFCSEMPLPSVEVGFRTKDKYLPPTLLLFRPALASVARSQLLFVQDAILKVGCSPGFWRNDQNNCTKAVCTPGKLLDTTDNSSTCKTSIPDVRCLGYDVNIILVARTEIHEEDITEIEPLIKNRFSNISSTMSLHITYFGVCCQCDNENDDKNICYTIVDEIHIFGYIISPYTISRDTFEGESLGGVFQSPWVLRVQSKRHAVVKTVSLQIVSLGKEMAAFYPPPTDLIYYEGENWQEFIDRAYEDGNCIPESYSARKTSDKELPLNHQHISHLRRLNKTSNACFTVQFPKPGRFEKTEPRSDNNNYRVMDFRSKFIDAVPTLNCPHIPANVTGSSKRDNNSLQFTVSVHDTEINITFSTIHMSFEQGNLFLCLEFLRGLTDNLTTIFNPTYLTASSSLEMVSYYMDVACISISILCLIFTFLTYSLFPTLRSLPGRNNMCLCISLAATQISLIITSVFGVKGRMHETHCLLHAIVLHYSWLASLCWMNTCCVHMYRVFTSFRGPSAWSETKTHRHYCLYSFGLPFIIITVTVITTYITTNGASTGYNKDICLPDVSISPLISILAILTPFFITITVNAVLFIRTVKEIVQVTRLQQNTVSTRSKKGVITYFKLSTITGVFWSLEAAAVLTNNPVFILIATPFAALQGLFIFVSFMLNKTIHDLYMGLVHFRASSVDESRNRTVSSSASSGSGLRQTSKTPSKHYI